MGWSVSFPGNPNINGLVFKGKITGKPHDLHGKIDGFL